ncbi:hypothetical protein PENTCL1PPCAC_20956, partial [Pristionchus entomophagus]
ACHAVSSLLSAVHPADIDIVSARLKPRLVPQWIHCDKPFAGAGADSIVKKIYINGDHSMHYDYVAANWT